MRLFLSFLVLAICAFVCSGLAEKERLGGMMGEEKYIPIGDMKWKRQSVARSTYALFNAFQRHDLTAAMLHVSKHSIFIAHTLLPIHGVYQGKRGFLASLERMINTYHLTDSSFRVLFVDEARGYSVVEKTCSGAFRHNNATFENLKVMIFIKWRLGKISKLNVVELNPTRTYSLFQTKAEKHYMKLANALNAFGPESKEIREYMNNDVTVKISNLYPLSLLTKAEAKSNETKSNETVPSAAEDKDVDIIIKGKDNVMKFVSFANRLYFNLTASTKIIFSNDTMLVTAKLVNPTKAFFPAITNKKNYYRQLTIIYVVNHFDEKGLIKYAEFFINRPLLPWNLRYINSLIQESGEKMTVYDLFASLRPAISFSPSK